MKKIQGEVVQNESEVTKVLPARIFELLEHENAKSKILDIISGEETVVNNEMLKMITEADLNICGWESKKGFIPFYSKGPFSIVDCKKPKEKNGEIYEYDDTETFGYIVTPTNNLERLCRKIKEKYEDYLIDLEKTKSEIEKLGIPIPYETSIFNKWKWEIMQYETIIVSLSK